ncbi:MAG TPA: DUF58 domain-containing protein, partial [Acidimicrobiales bacterium]|nr:DUF58 domain-containing protein [Acidimicrobiales bacterium]
LKVYPAFGSRREAELKLDRARILDQGMRAARTRGGATLFEQLREYSVDDDSRRIDWAATARASKPIVRTYRAERNQRVLCLVDSGRTMAAQVGGVARLEHAIDAVMMLTSVASRLGDMPGVVAFDSAVRASVPLRAGASQLGRVTEALYQLQPRLVATDYRGALAEVLARAQRRALLCLLTELDEALADTLFPVLPLIAREHVLIVAAVTDPDVAAWAAGEAGSPGTGHEGEGGDAVEATYLSAAALLALRRRRQLAHHLRAAGAVVIDSPPGRLAPALSDAYLDIKAAGRL